MNHEQLPQTEVNGYTFHFQESGRGEPVVFVHGSVSDYRTWQQPVAGLREDFRCFTYSRRFHWPNTPIHEKEDYPMWRHVDDLEGLVGRFDGPVHLVGHSYGAFICLLAAMRSPDRYRSMVLAEPPVITLYVSNIPRPQELVRLLFIDPVLALTIVQFGIRGMRPAIKAAQRHDMGEAVERFGRAVLGERAFLAMTEARRQQVDANLVRAEFTGSGLPKVDQDIVRSVSIPVLLLTGQNSPRLFRLLNARLERLLPQAEGSVIPDASHNMHEDNTEAYIRAVRSFIRAHATT